MINIVSKEVKSSVIKYMTYDEKKKILTIEFIDGDVYDYFDFGLRKFENFAKADSKGKYFNDKIKGKYRFEVIYSRNTKVKM